ncbi:MAG TPA: RlpA-like double-psi beta-barrel domain-containing protein [Patescibacteria group bacterium]|nr:RlpA-like double-psi beta-barrel domain-containing protein [Patescibacteria group bacterium]
MQFRYFLTIFFSFLIFFPSIVKAESRHYEVGQVSSGLVFTSTDGTFELKSDEIFSRPLDVYFFKKNADVLKSQLNPLSDIYEYYVYADEAGGQTEFTVTLHYQGDYAPAKTVYYYDYADKIWKLASTAAFLNNLTFKIKGQKNRLAMVGANLHQATAGSGEKRKLSEIYSFNLKAPDNQVQYEEVCRPYLTAELSANKGAAADIKKLQIFLNKYEGFADLPLTGYFGNLTHNAVVKFQEKYAKDILRPWGLSRGTGLVKKTTLDKINELHCQYEKQKTYQITLSYELTNKQAKSIYSLDEQGEWRRLESFDNQKTKRVKANLESTSAQVAVFEEADEWVGEASWYGYQGGYFAASRDFAKGARIKVTNQSDGENQGKSVIVTINDYGPELWTGRIIDLDKVAFEAIGNLKGGVMPVRIEVVNN